MFDLIENKLMLINDVHDKNLISLTLGLTSIHFHFKAPLRPIDLRDLSRFTLGLN